MGILLGFHGHEVDILRQFLGRLDVCDGCAEMKAFLSAILTLVVVTVLMALLAEWTVRWMFAETTVLFPRYHTEAHYGDYTIRRIRPKSRFRHTSIDGSWEFVTNSQGFRNLEDFSYEKPAGVYRVLVLGDSHTQGYEVRQNYTYSAVLERYLRAQGVEAQVINSGVSGFSTAEALVMLENEGLKYQPDAVVLGFFANDFEDNVKAGIFELQPDGKLVAVRKEYLPGVRIQNVLYSVPAIRWLGENSYFYSILFNTTWEFFKARLARQATQRVTEFAVPQRTHFSDYETNLALALLGELYELSQENNIPFILIDIPSVDSDGHIGSSLPAGFANVAGTYSAYYLDSPTTFSDYKGVAELHVPHGHRHLSEFAHTVLGVETGKVLLRSIKGTMDSADIAK